MNALIIRSSIIFIMIAYLSSCNNDSGPTVVNPGNNSNNPPGVPNSPIPHDTATNVSNVINLSWRCADPDAGDTVKYNIYISPTNPPSQIDSNWLPTTYGYGVIPHNQTMYWKIVAKDNHGATTSGPVWKFTTAP